MSWKRRRLCWKIDTCHVKQIKVSSLGYRLIDLPANLWGWAEKLIRLKCSYDHVISTIHYDNFLPMGSKHCNTNGSIVWTPRGDILKNKPQLVIFHESILVSLRTFQLTLINTFILSIEIIWLLEDAFVMTNWLLQFWASVIWWLH